MAKVKFTTTLDIDLLKKVKKKAIDDNKKVNEIIEELLREWVRN